MGDALIGSLMASVKVEKSLSALRSEASTAGALAVTKAGAASSLPRLEDVKAMRADNALPLQHLSFDEFKRRM